MTHEHVNLGELRPAQQEVYGNRSRFRVLVAGRRFGKTHLAIHELIRHSWGMGKLVWYVAPSYRQAKSIAWQKLKEMSRPFWGAKPNETDLSIRLKWGGTIALRGADNYDSLRGNGLDFIVLDEYASMKSACWSEVLRPALADRQGGALFIGTPKGRDHLYERWDHARNSDDWEAFQYTTLDGGNVSAEELASAGQELDERAFRQEFEASFEVAGERRAYHAFSNKANVRPCHFDENNNTLIWAIDFNVSPMCSVIGQRVGDVVEVLDEIIIENAHTQLACEKFMQRIGSHHRGSRLRLEIFGDASGHQRRTCGASTDWALIRNFFRDQGDFDLYFRTNTSNPAVRDRINLVNARLRDATGDHMLFVDPRCKELIRDLEQVSWRTDSTGRATSDLDKSDRMRTHTSDALGYFVAEAFPLRKRDTFGTEPIHLLY